jgi:hypothetical protein
MSWLHFTISVLNIATDATMLIVKESKKTNSTRFTIADWIVVYIVGVLCVTGLLFGLFKLIEFEQQVLNNQISTVENDGEVRGSKIIDVFANKRSALILILAECNEGTECSEYLSKFFMDLLSVKKSAPQILVFDIVAARARGDTNLDVALERLNCGELPTLVLVEDGVEISRKEGIGNSDDEFYDWLVQNGIISDAENFRD